MLVKIYVVIDAYFLFFLIVFVLQLEFSSTEVENITGGESLIKKNGNGTKKDFSCKFDTHFSIWIKCD